MKTKNILIVVALLCFYIGNSQIVLSYGHLKSDIKPNSFQSFKIDSTKVVSLKMLSNVEYSELQSQALKGKILPPRFDWVNDAFRIESYKRMLFDFNKQDACGRDLLRDINQDLINQIHSKESKFSF